MFWNKPEGYALKAKDGGTPVRIAERAIPDGTQVILHNGLVFVNTEERDDSGFVIFEEGFLTHAFEAQGE